VSLSPLPSFVFSHSLTPPRLSAQSALPINVFVMVTVVVPKEGRRKRVETNIVQSTPHTHHHYLSPKQRMDSGASIKCDGQRTGSTVCILSESKDVFHLAHLPFILLIFIRLSVARHYHTAQTNVPSTCLSFRKTENEHALDGFFKVRPGLPQ